MTEEPQHWPTERMILEGHADYATHEDLAPMDDEFLNDLAMLCEVPTYAPDECIPCWAHAEFMERKRKRLDSLNPPDSADNGTEEFPETPEDDEVETPRLDALIAETPPWEPVPQSPVEDMVALVQQMGTVLEDILHGPPIPPKDVSLPELGLLVLAADRWIKVTEAQGVELSDNQQVMLDSTKALVARLRP